MTRTIATRTKIKKNSLDEERSKREREKKKFAYGLFTIISAALNAVQQKLNGFLVRFENEKNRKINKIMQIRSRTEKKVTPYTQ